MANTVGEGVRLNQCCGTVTFFFWFRFRLLTIYGSATGSSFYKKIVEKIMTFYIEKIKFVVKCQWKYQIKPGWLWSMRCKNLLFLHCHCIAIKISEKLLCTQITEVDADGSPKKDKEKVKEFIT